MSTRRPLHVLVGLAASVSLAALLVAVPAGLALWQGDPLPRTMPQLSDLNQPMTMDVIARCVAVLLWLAWAQFAFAVASEVRYQWPMRHQRAGGSPAHTRRFPLTGPSGSLAGRLVSLALLLTTASAALLPNADAATTARTSAVPARATTFATAPATVDARGVVRAESGSASARTDTSTISSVPGIPIGARYFTVVRHESLWRIAEECLGGDGPRYQEIYQLNKGRMQPDGRALTDRSVIQPGWRLIMPADAHDCPVARAAATAADIQPQASEYTVQSGDNLSSIAVREYREPADWTLIYRANQTRISDPDLIYPGQVLKIPTAPDNKSATRSGSSTASRTAASGSSTSATGSGSTGTSPSEDGSATSAPYSSPSTPAPTPSETPKQTTITGTADPDPVRSSRHATAPTTGATSAPAQSAQAPAMSGERTLWELIGIGGLAAAAAITTLDLRRRRQQRARREGEYIKMPQSGPTPTGLELALRSGSDAKAAAWMNRVMRAANAAAANAAELPDLHLICLGADALYVQPARPVPPVPPFEAAGDWWVCPRESPLPPPETLSDVAEPYPALITVGHDEHGRAILLDLESIRCLALPGPVGLGALRAIALELVGRLPSDQITVTLVGVGIELAYADLPASLNLAADLETAIDALEGRVGFAAGQLTASGAGSVRAARLGRQADAPCAHVVISAEEPTPEQAERIARALDSAPAACAAVISRTPIPVEGPAWILPATGATETLEPAGVGVLGQYLTDAAYAQLIEHFRVGADLESTPTPGWVAPIARLEADEGKRGREAHESDREYATDSGSDLLVDSAESDHRTTAPGDDDEIEAVDPADYCPGTSKSHSRPHLVGGLTSAMGFPPASVRPESLDGADLDAPRLLLLGQIQLVGARGSVESSRASKLRELAAYMALNPGSTATELTEAVWPQGTTQKNRNTSANKLRSWLGRDEAGEPFFPKAYGGYRLAPGVGCDLLEFSTLYSEGARARGSGADREAAAAFTAALVLVRGRPFAGAEPRRYGWAEPILQRIVSEIVDAVRYLAGLCMAEGDWMQAAAIAAWGMGIGPEHESLFRLRFEAIYRMGDQLELDRLSTVLQSRLAEIGLTMQDETQELLEELLHQRAEVRPLPQ